VITKTDFLQLLVLLDDQGRQDVSWAENVCAPREPNEFALEIIYVICNSGMKWKVACGIYNSVRGCLSNGIPVKGTVLGRSGKAAAIDRIWNERAELFTQYCALTKPEDQLAFIAALPWIGDITKYHVAKNFDVGDYSKPDVHLQRLADREGVTPQQLCERLAKETGYRVATVDTILWRACAMGILNSSTGAIHEDRAAASAWH
jgi:hypothetical protein